MRRRRFILHPVDASADLLVGALLATHWVSDAWTIAAVPMILPATFALRATLLTCLAVLATAPLLAAPIDSKDVPATQPGMDPATALPMPAGGTGAPSGTVELLLQMQNQSAAAPPAERRTTAVEASAKPSATTALPAEGPASSTLLELKSSLLGAGAPLGGDEAASRGDRADPVMRPDGVTGYSGSRGGGAAPRDADGGLLANPVIRFIRGNRELAIGGSIALLVAVWLTANYRGRSHRRR